MFFYGYIYANEKSIYSIDIVLDLALKILKKCA